MSLLLQMYAKMKIYTLVKYGDTDNLTVFIYLLIITFYKIHMGVIYVALKVTSLPVSPFLFTTL